VAAATSRASESFTASAMLRFIARMVSGALRAKVSASSATASANAATGSYPMNEAMAYASSAVNCLPV